jgi:ferredoxin
MRDVSAAITARGVPPEQIAMEVFGAGAVITPGVAEGDRPAPHRPAGAPGRGPAVTFSRSKLTVAWDPAHSSLLELAEACDVPVGFGCRTGVCHYCETGILAGEITYTTEPLERPGEDRILVCCSQPRSEVALEL